MGSMTTPIMVEKNPTTTRPSMNGVMIILLSMLIMEIVLNWSQSSGDVSIKGDKDKPIVV